MNPRELEEVLAQCAGKMRSDVTIVQDDGRRALRTDGDTIEVRLRHVAARRRLYLIGLTPERLEALAPEKLEEEVHKGAAEIIGLPSFQVYVDAFPEDPDDPEGVGPWWVVVTMDHVSGRERVAKMKVAPKEYGHRDVAHTMRIMFHELGKLLDFLQRDIRRELVG